MRIYFILIFFFFLIAFFFKFVCCRNAFFIFFVWNLQIVSILLFIKYFYFLISQNKNKNMIKAINSKDKLRQKDFLY